MTITLHTDQVTPTNANDVVNVAHMFEQVVASRGVHKNLSDSIHALKGQSVINLPPNDLCHRLNKLWHKPASKQPGFLLIAASSIPKYNHLDKLNFVRAFFQTLAGFLNIN